MMRKIVLIALLFAGVVLKAQTTLPASQALYIYNFLRYIQWADNKSENIQIAVYGESPIYDELVKITRNRKIGPQGIVVIKSSDIQDLNRSQVVFVPKENVARINAIKKQMERPTIVIVSETSGTIADGSSIELVPEGNKLGFKINTELAKTENLLVSQQLIKMSQ